MRGERRSAPFNHKLGRHPMAWPWDPRVRLREHPASSAKLVDAKAKPWHDGTREVRLSRNLRRKCQMTCKPGSVRSLAAPGWPFLWDGRCRPPHATYPRIRRGSRPVRIAPDPSSYAVLLPAGFAVPRPLPAARCALTAPFHPCRRTGRTRVIGGLFSVALSLGSRPPAVNRRRSSMEPGLSSTLRREQRPSGHLAGMS